LSTSDIERRVDGFLAQYTPEMEAHLRAARERLRARFPRGYELIVDNYNALVFAISPTDKTKDAFISVAGHPRWVTLFFLHGVTLHDPQGLLEGTGRRVRGIRLMNPAILDAPAVVALIDQAVAAEEVALASAPPLTSIVRMVIGRQRERRPAAGEAAQGEWAEATDVLNQPGLVPPVDQGPRRPVSGMQDPSVPVTLAPMGDADFQDYLGMSVGNLANDKIRSGQWAPQTALERAHASFHELLPLGRVTPGHDLFTIRDGRSGLRVGFLWIGVQARADLAVAYVYDVLILSASRRMGYGLRTFEALDRLVAERGLTGIALHVFGHNTAARALYERIGFVTTNLNLFKRIGPRT